MKYGKGFRMDADGWIFLHIEGDPLTRGFQHGYLVADELEAIMRSCKYLTFFNTGKTWEFFVEAAVLLHDRWLTDEIRNEIIGISNGAQARGKDISWQDILAWNAYEELTDYWWPNVQDGLKYEDHPVVGEKSDFHFMRNDHCSAFMAHRGATVNGEIVMAHNSWNNFEMGQFSNVILDILPSQGHRMFMQSAPGYIDSFADFFVTDAGLMGTETTIGGFSEYDPEECPEYVRVRLAMQYGNSLDDFKNRMKKHNNGGYANAWLIGDVNTGDIMRYEQGLRFDNVELNPKCGYFIGFNAPLDPRIRNLECSDTGFCDIRRHKERDRLGFNN